MKTVNLKKVLSFVIATVMVCAIFAGIVILNSNKGEVLAESNSTIITLQIGSPTMTLDGKEQKIDEEGTVPIIISDRTLLPVRAVVEAMGGAVQWEADTLDVILTCGDNVIVLTIDATAAYLNEEMKTLDVAPVIINDRTMLPIRFIAESFGFDVDWDDSTQTVTITVKKTWDNITMGLEHETANAEAPQVYLTRDISPEAIMKIYEQLGFKAEGNVAIKLSTGEAGNTHYLDPNLIKDLVQSVDGTIVECNTAYGGARATTEMHRQVAKDHGFTEIADVDIMDADGTMELPVSDKAVNLTKDIIGKNYANYDSMLVLSHFKGHAMGGFGGAIKNISIGIGSSDGKMYIHSGGHSTTSWSGGTQDQFLESMAEAAQAVHNDKQQNGGIVYISVMNHLSVDCDCDGNPAAPEMHDFGILASTDPVALDQACVDIVYNTPREESGALIERIESRNGSHTLEHAEKIGLGSREYRLVSID